MEPVFQANALCKSYGGRKALDGLTMQIQEGAIYGFVGRNGAGKTTLMRLLCGLQFPSGGTFSLFGTQSAANGLREARRRIGAMVEAPAVNPRMTAEENMRQQYRILGLPSFQGITELLRQVGLAETGRKEARHFSQGMRQKLGIAMAMAGEPEFLVLDEPANGLDPQGIIDLRALIQRLNQERHITFLLSSHILDELSRVATHYGFIDQGRMIRQMTADELIRDIRKSLRVRVSDTRCLAAALTRDGIPHKILSNTEADIFSEVSLTRLALELAGEDCEIYTCREESESLEAYFIRLVGGECDA